MRREHVKFPRAPDGAPDAESLASGDLSEKEQVAVMSHRTLSAVRPVQHNVRPVTLFSVENGWPTFGLGG